MFSKAYLLLFLLIQVVASDTTGFAFYEGFKLSGVAEVAPDGNFKLINKIDWGIGYTFYSLPITFKNSPNGNAISFSTKFVFAIVPEIHENHHGLGMALVIAASKMIPGVRSSDSSALVGLVNVTDDGKPNNHGFAIELDTSQQVEFKDINDNHVGIDINSLTSLKSSPAGYFANEKGEFKNLTLASGEPIQAWVDYDGLLKQLNVTIFPINVNKPNLPLIALEIDLSPVMLDQMYVGFSSSVGVYQQSHYVLGWSFQMNGKAPELDLSKLPSLPSKQLHSKKKQKTDLVIGLLVTGLGIISILATIIIVLFLVRRKIKFTEVLEDWEVQYGPHRFPYKDLFVATKGFRKSELLGSGGFGQVYKGMLPVSNTQVAVKRISHESRQGMKEFVAEIATIGRLRHPNLVRLLDYCRRKGELFLVYDFMPNGSLDKFLFKRTEITLDWHQRLKIITDVASGLAYLHEGWVEVIIHRDIKASNVLLDSELNGKLGDFGLARCSIRGNDPQTTHVAGTLGYIAPELARNGKATTSTDVFAFGAFCLEVACGRRPVELQALPEEVLLVDLVSECWRKGEILKTADPELKNDFEVEEMKMVLMLGLLCSHPVGAIRPSMSRVVQYLKGHASLPEKLDDLLWTQDHDRPLLQSSSQSKDSSKPSLTITESFSCRGR